MLCLIGYQPVAVKGGRPVWKCVDGEWTHKAKCVGKSLLDPVNKFWLVYVGCQNVRVNVRYRCYY